MNPAARLTRGALLRGARPFVGGLLLAFVGAAASAQQNPIITATQAPPPYGGSPYGFGGTPYGYGSPYGQPYGYPYQSYNPSLNQLTNPPQQNGANGGVPSQPSVPGQTQIGGGGGGGGSGGGGGGGNNGGNGGGSKTDGAGYGSTGQANGASYEILQNPDSPLYKRYERHDNSQQPLRPEILTQIGRGKGIRRGFIEESHRIAATLEATAARLDARFDFQKQMIGEHLVPPVIGEVHDLQESGGDRLLYLTVGSYQIVRSARLVLTPPSWRDYLVIEPAETQTSISALAPQNGQEQSVYDHAYDDGLAKGISEARGTFEANLDRLQRDYAGMERYHELAEKGAVSIPVVRDAKRSVHLTDRGQRALVGEQVVRLQVSPKFKAARPGAFKVTARVDRREILAGVTGLLLAGSGASDKAYALDLAAFDRHPVGRESVWLRRPNGQEIMTRFRTAEVYDPQQVLKLSWFMRDIADHDQAVWMDPRLFDLLAGVQAGMSAVHGAPVPLVVTSGYRTPEHNARIETAARNSMHLYGYAADLCAPGYDPRAVALAASFYAGGGIGMYEKFTHLDVWRKRLWFGPSPKGGMTPGQQAPTIAAAPVTKAPG